ncbi:MAG TPA: SpoIIE family protein phosphatase [Candidatus Eremiobacteraceae bacterium]|nr:SpoIIE family protein phosphatase [Candidatus Eremiobacteraceae bacterium]
MVLNSIRTPQSSGSGVFPALVLVQGNEQKNIVLNRTPFSVGRKVDKDLVIADPRVSRDHALIVLEEAGFFLVDQGSKHGTFVNGERIQRQKLERNDRLEFGARDSTYAIFNPAHGSSNTARDFLSQISGIQISQETTDLEKLTLFLEAARKLNTVGVLDESLMTMLEVTLRLTRAERAYVFLKDDEGKLRLAAGRNSKGESLLDDKTISHSALDESLRSNKEFLLSDTGSSGDLTGRESIVAYDLRTVICIPLRKRQVQASRDQQTPAPNAATEVTGVLYVDSRFASREFTGVGQDVLRAIAIEAASLIENARLVQAEEESRRYQQELTIAAGIQQLLMRVKIPDVPFAKMNHRNVQCKEIGGDFYDAVNTKEGLAVVLADVSGKGVSAALLASTLQGMIYSHLTSGMGLLDVVTAVNRFFTEKMGGEKYATLLLVRLRRDGELEYVNCGHVQPLLVCKGEVMRPPHGNVPVGLLPDATFESATCQLKSGDRFILVTDGVTEAENAMGDFFEDWRLEAAAAKTSSFEGIFSAVSEFCAGNPLNDDCTVVEIVYASPAGEA